MNLSTLLYFLKIAFLGLVIIPLLYIVAIVFELVKPGHSLQGILSYTFGAIFGISAVLGAVYFFFNIYRWRRLRERRRNGDYSE